MSELVYNVNYTGNPKFNKQDFSFAGLKILETSIKSWMVDSTFWPIISIYITMYINLSLIGIFLKTPAFNSPLSPPSLREQFVCKHNLTRLNCYSGSETITTNPFTHPPLTIDPNIINNNCIIPSPHPPTTPFNQGGRGHWIVYYNSPQSLTFSYSLD